MYPNNIIRLRNGDNLTSGAGTEKPRGILRGGYRADALPCPGGHNYGDSPNVTQ